MRALIVLVVVSLGSARAAEEARYGIAPDLKTYPQATAKDTLASVLKTVENKRCDYLVAQLAEPSFIDERVKRLYGGRFEQQVEDTQSRLDPLAVKLLGRFLKDGEWTADKDTASVRLKDVKDRAVFFKRIGERWYLEHRVK
jgi:hypothetical protein